MWLLLPLYWLSRGFWRALERAADELEEWEHPGTRARTAAHQRAFFEFLNETMHEQYEHVATLRP